MQFEAETKAKFDAQQRAVEIRKKEMERKDLERKQHQEE